MPERHIFLFCVLIEVFLAVLLTVTDVELRYDLAKASVTVTSQMAFFPVCQEVGIRPSGRFPLERDI